MAESRKRLSIRVYGTVQGVGFRPFVYIQARQRRLTGFVRNTSSSVEIEAAGPAEALDSFVAALTASAPPQARISRLDCQEIADLCSEQDFQIRASAVEPGLSQSVPPDAATCADCVRELFDPGDRRYRYPFINCTNCGPRFTIIRSLPYDRPATTMSSFEMCRQCRDEYNDPANRRFHAQPNACWLCGPSLTFIDRVSGVENSREEALASAEAAILAGKIVAVRGLGGFHLMCDATSDRAVQALRERKNRYGKPLALVLKDRETIMHHCSVGEAELAVLASPAAPILVAPLRNQGKLSAQLAPGTNTLGVMLPYTPLQHLLLADLDIPLVATSGNRSEEPIVTGCDEALERLSSIADCFLMHDREIVARYDDSVCRAGAGAVMTVRRSRGFAPGPVDLAFSSESVALGCGAHLKSTFCFIRGSQAFLSQHIGDMDSLEAEEFYEQALDRYCSLFALAPVVIATDSHRDYATSRLGEALSERLAVPKVAVQHHHAHIVSTMAEHGLAGPVIGAAFDGLGLGEDGQLWGGEFLLVERHRFQRLAHLAPVPLPGGEACVRQPLRTALAYALTAPARSCPLLRSWAADAGKELGEKAVRTIERQIERQLNSPLTSSAGRLFDAVSALLGICRLSLYEGQAAIELEAAARAFGPATDLRLDFELARAGELWQIEPRIILEQVMSLKKKGYERGDIAWRFHNTLAWLIGDACAAIREQTGVETVCLGGGVFQNAILSAGARARLEKQGFRVFFPVKVPVNDGGLSLGQAVVALARQGWLA